MLVETNRNSVENRNRSCRQSVSVGRRGVGVLTNSASGLSLARFLALGVFAAGLLLAPPSAEARRSGDKDTVRVPSERTALIESLLEQTDEADATGRHQEARERREARMRAAAQAAAAREARLQAAAAARRAPKPAPKPVAAPAPKPAPAAVAPAPREEAASIVRPMPAAAKPAPAAEPVVAATPQPSAAELELPDLAEVDPASDTAEDAPAAAVGPKKASNRLGDSVRIIVIAAAALFLLWVFARRKKAARAGNMVPTGAKFLGKTQAGASQIQYLELPDEILVLGVGDQGFQVLARVSDPEKMAALRKEQGSKTSAGGFGGLLKGLLDKTTPRAAEDVSESLRLISEPAAPAERAPADILAAEKAFELHEALGRTGLADTSPVAEASAPADDLELPEVNVMKQRLADLRAGRFVQ